MRSTLEKEIEMLGYPIFIKEINHGKFQVVRSILEKVESDKYSFKLFEQVLEEGLDIREYPNRNITILIESPRCETNLYHMIEKLRDFAYIGSYDYFSIQDSPIRMTNNSSYRAVPRLFRKLIDN